MKPWKVVSLILFARAVATVGYRRILARRGFSALATPSAIEEFAAATARILAVTSAYRQPRNPIIRDRSYLDSAMVARLSKENPIAGAF